MTTGPKIRHREIVMKTTRDLAHGRKSFHVWEYMHFEHGGYSVAQKRFAYRVYRYGAGTCAANLALEKSKDRPIETVMARAEGPDHLWRKVGSFFVQQDFEIFFVVYSHTVRLQMFEGR